MNLLLTRVDSTEHGIFGHLTIADNPFSCVTLERHDLAIPPGKYLITWYNSPEHGIVPLINNVPGRSMIEIHEGNWEWNSKGCVLVGRSRAVIEGQDGVSTSKDTLKALINVLNTSVTPMTVTVV